LTEDTTKQNKKSKKKSEKNITLVVNINDDNSTMPIIILSSKEDVSIIETPQDINAIKLKSTKKINKKPQELPNSTDTGRENDSSSVVEAIKTKKPNKKPPEMPISSDISKENDSCDFADSAGTTNGDPDVKKLQNTNTSQNCLICGNTFSSKNKLFLHIKETGHAILKSAGPSLEQQPRASVSVNAAGKSLKSKKSKTKR